MTTNAPAVPTADTMASGTTTEGGSPAEELMAFLAEVLPAYRAEHGKGTSWEARLAWQRLLHRGGWVAPAWALENGGRGLGPRDLVAVEEVLATAGGPVLAGVLGVKNVGPAIAAWGTPEQKQHLPRILSTEEIWCQGFSEPDAGSDLAGLRTRAVAEGDEFVIEGEKIWTSEGMYATHCQVLARTDPNAPKHHGISALLVPLDDPRVHRSPIRQLTGESSFAALHFDGVRVPRSALLGPEHEGWRVTMTTLGYERAGVAVMATRHEEDVLEYVAQWRERGAGQLSAVERDELVQRYIEARVVGMIARKVLTAIAEGRQPGPAESMIKLVWSLAMQEFSATRADLAGFAAYAGGAPEESYAMLRSLASTIAAGTTEVVKNIIAERSLGLPRE